jgi:PHD-finger
MEAEAEARGGPEPMDVEPPQPSASSLDGPPTIAKVPLAPASSKDPQDITPPERPPNPPHATPDSFQVPIPPLARASLEVLQDINSPERILQPSHATTIGSQAANIPPLNPPLDQTSELVQESVTEPAPPRTLSLEFGKASVFRVDQSTSAWQTAKDALEAGMNGLSSISHSQRTGGRRGRGPRRHLSPVPSGSITLKPHDSMPTSAPPTTPRRGSGTRRGRGGGRGRGRKSFSGTKRKRGTDSDDEHDNGTSSSEEITALPSQSRSGRKITQAHQTSNAKLDLEDEDELEESPMPAPRRNASFSTSVPAPSPAASKPPLYKPAPKKVKRTPGQYAVCKNCSRGPSPASNAIVFCDGCNTPWHQHCHEPPIKQEFLLEVDRDWFCADCVLLREHSVMLEGKVAGHGMSMLEV